VTQLARILDARIRLLDVALVGLCLLLVLLRHQPSDNPVQSDAELAVFRERYGPDHNTEREEEWFIRDFFDDRRGGVFVDVGANHYRVASKTYFLETALGWSGLAIEPQTEYAADYQRFRPRSRFLPFFVSSQSNLTAQLYLIHDARFLASGNREFVRQFGEPDEVRSVPTVSLNDVLAREGVSTIDFLAMDIELHEPEALRGLDLVRYRPRLVCIEGLLPVRQQILDHFAARGYVVVGKYLWVDRENLYFTPLAPVESADR
jgi:FkbM family methyltransferase